MRLLSIFFAGVLLFFCIAGSVLAYDIDSHTVKYNVVDNKVFVQSEFNFSQKSTGMIELSIPLDATTVEVYLDGKKASAEIINGYADIRLNRTNKVKLSYITNELIDKSNFLLNMFVDYDTELLKIILVLPEGAVLKEHITDRGGSVYPRPDKTGTDGKSLIFMWERADLKGGEDISIFTMYKTRKNYLPLIALLIAVVGALAAYIVLSKTSKAYAKKYKKAKKEVVLKTIKTKKKDTELLEHLKEDEQQIVRVLKQKNGSCEQGTLRVVTNFSKAHLSRLLMELEARKIIYKEKRGKKNLIFLK